MMLEFSPYLRKPFDVDAVEVTEENFDEIAALIGSEVKDLEGGGRVIVVDRTKVPTVNRVYVGWVLTKVGDNLRCYNRKTFNQQFRPRTAPSPRPGEMETAP